MWKYVMMHLQQFFLVSNQESFGFLRCCLNTDRPTEVSVKWLRQNSIKPKSKELAGSLGFMPIATRQYSDMQRG